MALLRTTTTIVRRALIDLFFDDESEKHLEIGEKDIVRVRFNDAGYAREIIGKVNHIEEGDGFREMPPSRYNCPPGGCIPIVDPNGRNGSMIVDGSDIYSGNTRKIFFKDILDMDVIEKYDEQLIVKTTTDGAATKIRVYEGALQIYTNGDFVNIDELLTSETKTLLEQVKTLVNNNSSENTTPEPTPETIPESTTEETSKS